MDRLNSLRKQIDEIDEQIINLITQRFEVVMKIGKYKKKNNLPLLDMKRWKQVLQTKIELAEKLGLDPQLIEDIYNRMHKYSLEIEKRIE